MDGDWSEKKSEERTQKRDAKRQSVSNRSALRHKNEGEGAKTILGGDQSKEGDKKDVCEERKELEQGEAGNDRGPCCSEEREWRTKRERQCPPNPIPVRGGWRYAGCGGGVRILCPV